MAIKSIILEELEEKLPTFDEIIGELTEREVDDFSEMVEEVHLVAGAILFSEGTSSDNLYIIADGQIGIFKNNPHSGRSSEIARLGKGNILGEMAFLVEKYHSATAKALCASTALRITKKKFQDMEKINVKLCYKIVLAITKVLSYRLKKRNVQVTKYLS